MLKKLSKVIIRGQLNLTVILNELLHDENGMEMALIVWTMLALMIVVVLTWGLLSGWLPLLVNALMDR